MDVQSNQILPDRSYKPPSETPRPLDTYPFGQQGTVLHKYYNVSFI